MAFLDSICLCLFHKIFLSQSFCLYPSPFDPHLKPFLLCVQWRQEETGVVVQLERRERESEERKKELSEKERVRKRERKSKGKRVSGIKLNSLALLSNLKRCFRKVIHGRITIK